MNLFVFFFWGECSCQFWHKHHKRTEAQRLWSSYIAEPAAKKTFLKNKKANGAPAQAMLFASHWKAWNLSTLDLK